MKKSSSNIIWGVIFIVLGAVFTMRAFGFHLNIFFDGWWTLFIIIPSLIGLGQNKDRASSIIGLGVGILLFFSSRGWIGWGMFGKFVIALIFLVIGISMVFKRSHRVEDFQERYIKGNSKNRNYSAIFAGNAINFDNEPFTGANLSAAFGSITLDLSNAIFTEDVVIEAMCALGGIDIKVPDYVKVVANCTPILGGIDNHKRNYGTDGAPAVIIYINATCILGGIDIK